VVLLAFGIGPLAAVGEAAEYHVSPQGADSAVGSSVAPWKTLAKACQQAGAGDTIFVHAGVYRETLAPQRSGEPGQPIRFQAAAGEQPVISGADLLAATWHAHRANIFLLKTERKFVQLFVDGQMMPEARWPNSPPRAVMTYARAKAGQGTGYETLCDPQLPPGDWNGGVVLMWPGSAWVSATRRIADYQPGKSLRFEPTLTPKHRDKFHAADPYEPRAGNWYLLYGSLAGLDSPGEWFLDPSAGVVYLWTPDGASPETHVVEVRQRDYACDLRKRAFIEIRGFDILGAAVTMDAAHDCLLDDCRLRYVEHYREFTQEKTPPTLNVMTGKNNEWRRCLVAYAAASALHVGGEDNRLVNCVLHDANYLGTAAWTWAVLPARRSGSARCAAPAATPCNTAAADASASSTTTCTRPTCSTTTRPPSTAGVPTDRAASLPTTGSTTTWATRRAASTSIISARTSSCTTTWYGTARAAPFG
jgi:hypothetical protein